VETFAQSVDFAVARRSRQRNGIEIIDDDPSRQARVFFPR
jgi:hypothetical protein